MDSHRLSGWSSFCKSSSAWVWIRAHVDQATQSRNQWLRSQVLLGSKIHRATDHTVEVSLSKMAPQPGHHRYNIQWYHLLHSETEFEAHASSIKAAELVDWKRTWFVELDWIAKGATSNHNLHLFQTLLDLRVLQPILGTSVLQITSTLSYSRLI